MVIDQGSSQFKQLDLQKEILYQRRESTRVDGLFKLEKSGETLFKIESSIAPITIFLLIVPTSVFFTFIFFYSIGSLHLSVNNSIIVSFALTALLYFLISINSSHYIDIKLDNEEKIGKIKSKNLFTSKNYIFVQNQLKLIFISNQKANFFINDEKYDILINKNDKILLKVIDNNKNIIIEIINPDSKNYPKTLNIIFNEQIDNELVVFLTSSIVQKVLIDTKRARRDAFIRS